MTANRLGGLMMGFGLVLTLGMMVLSLAMPSSPTPVPEAGLVYPFTYKGGGTGYQLAFEHFFTFPVVVTGILLSNLGWLITPKQRPGGANLYDREPRKKEMKLVPVEYAATSYGVGGFAALLLLIALYFAFGRAS